MVYHVYYYPFYGCILVVSVALRPATLKSEPKVISGDGNGGNEMDFYPRLSVLLRNVDQI